MLIEIMLAIQPDQRRMEKSGLGVLDGALTYLPYGSWIVQESLLFGTSWESVINSFLKIFPSVSAGRPEFLGPSRLAVHRSW